MPTRYASVISLTTGARVTRAAPTTSFAIFPVSGPSDATSRTRYESGSAAPPRHRSHLGVSVTPWSKGPKVATKVGPPLALDAAVLRDPPASAARPG